MKKIKLRLITSALLILIGCLIFTGAMTMLNWDFTKLSTVKFETNNYEINEQYKSISIVTDTADITFIPRESANTSVVCREHTNLKHSVMEKDNTLCIELVDNRKWYEYIGINIGSQKITVYLPKAEYNMLTIKESTGDIEIPKDFNFNSIDIKTSTGNINAEKLTTNTLNLSVSTGNINLKDISCESLTTNGSTGRVTLQNVIATDSFSIKRSAGDIKFDKCDANDILIETDTGNVKGSLLSDKVFIARSDTGKINVPKTATGGKCEITTDTGYIKIDIIKLED